MDTTDTTDTENMTDFGGYLARALTPAIAEAWSELTPAVLDALRLREAIPCPPDVGSLPVREQARAATAATVGLRRRMPGPVRDMAARDGRTFLLPKDDLFPEISSLLLQVDPRATWVAMRAAFGPESAANPGIPEPSSEWAGNAHSKPGSDIRMTMAHTLECHGPEWANVFQKMKDWADLPARKFDPTEWGWKKYDWAPNCSFSPDQTEEEHRAAHDKRLVADVFRKRHRSEGLCMVNIAGPQLNRWGNVVMFGYSQPQGELCEEKATRFFELSGSTWCLCQSHVEDPPTFLITDHKERWLDSTPYEVTREKYEEALAKRRANVIPP